MKDLSSFLQYIKLIIKNWVLWLFFILDFIGFLIVYFIPDLKISTSIYIGLAMFGLLWAGFNVYHELEKKIPLESNSFEDLEQSMPDLIAEMKVDFSKPENNLVREFLLLKKVWLANLQDIKIVYYYEDIPKLQEKITVLENRGYIFENSISDLKKYRITEEFFSYLANQ
jgi:hypothetical protein